MLSSFLKNLFENEQKKDPNKKINEVDFNKEMKPYAEKNVKWLFIRGQLIHDKKLELKNSSIGSRFEKKLKTIIVEVAMKNIVFFEKFKQYVIFQIKPNNIIELNAAINGIDIL